MNIFNLSDDNNVPDKINLDDLYESKRINDQNKLNLYNKILNRIHTRIKTTARQNKNIQFVWYVVPEIMIGVPKYDSGECVAYIIDKLRDNGFIVKYTHPNLLFISWKHWVPNYVRQEVKKKTGMSIDGYGNKVTQDNNNKSDDKPTDLNTLMFKKNPEQEQDKKKDFTSISEYKPIGIYNNDLFKKIENKSNNIKK
tara:strand:- start:6376 stop:6966 length:591 start_codon:yes stop_codon:yes gene_type:complete